MFNASTSLLKDFSTTFDKRKYRAEKEARKAKKLKMTTWETYEALLKAYCALSMLVMPKAFQNGGWAASGGFQIASATLTTICAFKLVEAGLKLGLYSYSLVVEKVLGWKGRVVLDIMIALTQISFAISH